MQFSTLSFDIAVEEIFPAWISGATVVLRGDDAMLDPSQFTRWIDREEITVLDLPTAYWHAWVEGMAGRGDVLPASLRLVVVGGEKAQASTHARWRGLAGDRVRWINTYGPTEATVIATAFEPEGPADDLPIGRPIANLRAYVLDRQSQPVAIGLPGELYLGGEGVARGYLGHPALTAEKFVPDPFGPNPGGRLFRTGDLARWRADGVLEFLGRVDHQVKIRGFRVEPGEIETALLAHPDVRAAAVLARKDGGGESRLDAHVVAGQDGRISPAILRQFLRERLPRHMIPATFSILDGLPLTPNGKVDRKALALLDRPEAVREGTAIRPRNEVEAKLAAIWEDLLDVRPVGVDDDFFDLGGHSLLAVRLLARIESQFGRALPLSALFLGATIEELATRLREPVAAGQGGPLVTIQPQGDGAPFFCVHPAGGIVYCFRELASHLGKAHPFHAFQAPGLDGEREPFVDLEAMAACYVEALKVRQPTGPYHLGGWSLGGLVAFAMAHRLRAAGDEVATLAIFDAQAPDPSRKHDPAVVEVARQLRELGDGLEILGMKGDDAGRDALVMAEVAGEMAGAFGGDALKLVAHLRALSPEQQRDAILAHFRIDQVYRDDVESGPERVARLWDVLRAGYLAGTRYAPAPYDGPVTLFVAGDRRPADPTMGWKRLAKHLKTCVIPGNHATILKAPGVAKLASALRAEIEGGR